MFVHGPFVCHRNRIWVDFNHKDGKAKGLRGSIGWQRVLTARIVDGSWARKLKYHPEDTSLIINRAGHPGQIHTRSVEGREKATGEEKS